MNKFNKRIYLVLVLFLASCLGKKKTEIVAPTIAPITEAIFAPGHLEAGHQFTLTAFNDGYIRQMLIKEKDTVSNGQLLVVQDDVAASIGEKSSEENLKISVENTSESSPVLQQLRAQLISAEQKLDLDNKQYERMQRLYVSRSVAKVDLDNAKMAYENSLASVRSLRGNIDATRLTLQKELINSRSQYASAAAGADYFRIKSPGDYMVYEVYKKQGELLRKGEAIALLGDRRELLVMLNIDEASIAKVRVGMKVLIELNTEKYKAYSARITRIYPYFDNASQSYKAEARFDTAPAGLIAGTLLQANIIAGHKSRAMLIPRSSLSPDGKVVIDKGGDLDTVMVKTGIISTDWVEVLGGLAKSDKVVKNF
ncbi:efflux RND transporter periplasmic adaptor subunit [Arcticibacter tournemirensis]|uniref:HlyD family efflux transporter periplasmic adaptor subunit n=1 Tax=Arcticibacter tournemirensis TaxID=699437 RepID=A0A4Q0M5D4_9SPHI|nr:HlyD family efflux transporter periplasmic adaptor subunit [Arcticibacter tournemirensis]RXF68197.1 HlyD family efflux transporter periplasmic adaptor subunit [Arcticibacter tournemirensis]